MERLCEFRKSFEISHPLYYQERREFITWGNMKIRLAYKLFLAFIFTSLMGIVIMVGTMQYFVARNFEDFLRKMEMERLDRIADRLSTEYRQYHSWDFIRNNPGALERLAPPSFPARGEGRPPEPPFLNGRNQGDMHGPPLPMPPRLFEPGITLFDAGKRVLAGEGSHSEDRVLKAIVVDGKTVGWLGMNRRDHPPDPLAEKFLSRQREAFFFTGCAVLILAALFAFLLSRHLLKPVDMLAQGANALASRRFDTRIRVSSGDELGRLADIFNGMAQAMERHEELRKQWISDISHELRTPIAVLRGEIEALQDGIRGMTPESLDSLHAEIMLLGKLVDDLHELSLADSGEFSAKKEPVDAGKVLEDIAGIYRPRFAQASLDLSLDRKPGGWFIIVGDKDRLSQVFSNILENTLRYTRSPGELRISCTEAGQEILIVFEDSEPGVPDYALEKLFDRLFRIDPARSRRNGGSGLGLAICRNIVDSMGGRISAHHASIGGLRLEIRLPLST